MRYNKCNKLISLKDEPFIELFRLEEDNHSIFGNYQRYDFFQLLWFTKAEGNNLYFIDFKEYEIKENDIVILYPGQVDRLDIRGKEGYLFAIENNILFDINQRLSSDYLNGYSSNIFLNPNEETSLQLKKIIELFALEYKSNQRLSLLTIYLEALLFQISSIYEDIIEYKDYSGSIVAQLMKLIDTHYREEKEIIFYAQLLGLSPKSLNQISKKGTGRTIKQHLQDRLILEIKKEIRIGEKSMKEIAFSMKFDDPAYFSRFFKSQTGVTPGEFKETR